MLFILGEQLYYLLAILVTGAAIFYMHLCKWDSITKSLVFCSVLLNYIHFYSTDWKLFSIDWATHADYVRYVAANWDAPNTLLISAIRHPPTYYFICAVFYKFSEICGSAEDPILVARHASMIMHTISIMITVNLFRLLFPANSLVGYIGLSLFLFWPLSVTMGGRLHCDILLYTAQTGVLLSIVQWGKDRQIRHVLWAFLWATLAVLAKNTGVMMIALVTCIALFTLYEKRQHLRGIVLLKLLCVISIALFACMITMNRAWIIHFTLFDSRFNTNVVSFLLQQHYGYFLSFNPLLLMFDEGLGLSQDMYWNILLHTLLTGKLIEWKHSLILTFFNVSWSVMLFFCLEGALFHRKRFFHQKSVMACCVLYGMALLCPMMFMRVLTGNVEYADARYMYPIVIIVCALFAKIIQFHQQSHRLRAYHFGLWVFASFMTIAASLYIYQYLPDSLFTFIS